MQRKRERLVSIDDVLAELDGPVKAIRDTSPQVRLHFRLLNQVDALIQAHNDDRGVGFMARLMALRNLPRTNPRQPAPIFPPKRPV